MRGWAALVLIAAVCVCSGCAKYYYQEGKTFEQCKRDYEECAAELAKRVTNNKPGAYERKYMEHCMKEKGYTTVTEDKLPLRAKREDPDLSLRGFLYGRRRGLAGALSGE
ncbi:MAG: hypothetical protein P8Z79_09445 [Sedimentisphaerales bacterium]|jgi:hypothetical protein